MDGKLQLSQVAQYIGRRCIDPPYGTGVDDQRMTALQVSLLSDGCLVAVAAAHHIVVSSGGHGAGVMWEVDDEESAFSKSQIGVLTVVVDKALTVVSDSHEHHEVPSIIAMDEMYRKTERSQYRKGRWRDQITAMQYRFGAAGLSVGERRDQ